MANDRQLDKEKLKKFQEGMASQSGMQPIKALYDRLTGKDQVAQKREQAAKARKPQY